MLAAEIVPLENLPSIGASSREVAVRYVDSDWKRVARMLGVMEDEKEGIRRGSYRGVLPLTWRSRRVYLVRDWPLQR